MKSFHKRLTEYIFNTSISVQDRSFVVFSCLVLVAMYAAIPLGLIMREPLGATLSTIGGAIGFSVFVYYVFKKNLISRAKIVLSVIVVFLFLPAMFFSNGGGVSGAPLWMLLGTIYIGLILEGRLRVILLAVNVIILIACWIVGYRYPELVTEYSRGQGYFDSVAGLFIVGGIIYVLILFCISLFRRDEARKNTQRMFEQISSALVNAIDAKDEFTNGHSERVAKYSKKIAEHYGKSPDECDEIYQIALLHDIGKIGIPEKIINKPGKLSDEEYEIIKKHTVQGAQILESVIDYPGLTVGAKYHHERYDGKGYPDGLKGREIPEIARIIAVADAYDAMTSKRSYRDAIPQQRVREEIVKGIATQFDPDFARIMIRLIDMDIEFKMRESVSGVNVAKVDNIHCESIYNDCSDDIGITRDKTKISFHSCPDAGYKEDECIPSLIVYDSLDGKVHPGEENNRDLLYCEYALIRLDGTVNKGNVRKMEVRTGDAVAGDEWSDKSAAERGQKYMIEAVRNRDHVLIHAMSEKKSFDVILALPDTSRFAFISLTGEHCKISGITVYTDENDVAESEIPRIDEEISYTKGCPEGDVPNIEADGPRWATTVGVPITKDMTITFHAMSYPTARLVWHCPYFCIFSSKNGQVGGDKYREYLLLKMDGENWESEEKVVNEVQIDHTGDFAGWENWMDKNKQGIDCKLKIRREGKMIFMKTENMGVSVNSISTVKDGTKKLYIALTGDQCAISNIRISREN